MNRGCLIALVAFGVCVLVLIVLVVVVPLYMFDIIRSAPRVPVATFLTDNSVAAITVDPNHKELIDLLNRGGNRMSWFLPYEAGAVVDLDPARKTRTVTFAGSPKHLGPAFMMMFGDKNAFPVSDMETKGIDTWLTPALTREKGAIIFRGAGAVEAETEALAVAHWPVAAPRKPVKLEGGHAIEGVIHNESGEGFLALEPFFRIDAEKVAAGGNTAGASAEAPESETVVESPAAESKPAAESEPANKALDTPTDSGTEGKKEEVSAAGLLEYAAEVRVLGDFTEAGDFKLAITARAKDAENAALAKTLLDGLRDVAQTDMKEDEITVTGATTISGEVVTSEIIFSGYKERFAKWLQEMQHSSGR